MKILHTSDWHLGRSFHGVGTHEAQTAFVDHLLGQVKEHQVDLVLISGDIYDRTLPPIDSVRLYDEAVARLVEAGAKVALISGNHDSSSRLGVYARLIGSSGVIIRTDSADIGTPLVLEDEHGPVRVYGIPYLHPSAERDRLDVDAPTHAAVLSKAAELIHADLAAHPGARSVVMSHSFIQDAEPSDSERDISVGGIGQVPATVFDGFTYVALGHLHGQQKVRPGMWYCGSPIPYSFSEAKQRKGALLVEVGASADPASVEVTPLPPSPFKRLAVLRGTIEDLLENPEHRDAEGAYCQVTVVGEEYPPEAQVRLRERFPDMLTLRMEITSRVEEATLAERIQDKAPLDVCCEFIGHVRQRDVDQEEKAALREAVEAAAAFGMETRKEEAR